MLSATMKALISKCNSIDDLLECKKLIINRVAELHAAGEVEINIRNLEESLTKFIIAEYGDKYKSDAALLGRHIGACMKNYATGATTKKEIISSINSMVHLSDLAKEKAHIKIVAYLETNGYLPCEIRGMLVNG